MTACECPVAGYCQRHKITKGSGWHQLCQTKQSYFDAWEAGTGPGQDRKPDVSKEQRRKRVEEAARRKKQLIAWLQLLHSAEDAGAGDTAKRLLAQKKKQKLWVATDARDAIGCLLRQCSCSRTDAVKRLNEQYPR
jgi:hypothetical protein